MPVHTWKCKLWTVHKNMRISVFYFLSLVLSFDSVDKKNSVYVRACMHVHVYNIHGWVHECIAWILLILIRKMIMLSTTVSCQNFRGLNSYCLYMKNFHDSENLTTDVYFLETCPG